ncbi:hypothetical protein, partial [Vallitalea sediminicola]
DLVTTLLVWCEPGQKLTPGQERELEEDHGQVWGEGVYIQGEDTNPEGLNERGRRPIQGYL